MAAPYYKPGGYSPPIQQTPQQQAPALAMPVSNPGTNGSNARYYLGNLQRGSDGAYTDGTYRYDDNGLSLDRPDSWMQGLPPANQSESYDVWRAPGGGPGAPGGGGGSAAGGGFPGLGASYQGMRGLNPFVSQILGLVSAAGQRPSWAGPEQNPGIGGYSPLNVQHPEGDLSPVQYEGAQSLEQMLKVVRQMTQSARGRLKTSQLPR